MLASRRFRASGDSVAMKLSRDPEARGFRLAAGTAELDCKVKLKAKIQPVAREESHILVTAYQLSGILEESVKNNERQSLFLSLVILCKCLK